MDGLSNHLKEHVGAITRLPEVDAASLVRKIAHHWAVSPGTVMAGAGTTQFIYTLPRALGVKHALILGPTYSDYEDACRLWQVDVDYYAAHAAHGFVHDPEQIASRAARADMVFVCNPNNPTGVMLPPAMLKSLCRRFPDTYFVVDESYLPFVPEADALSLIRCRYANLVVLVSMSKVFKIPGLRVGFLKSGKKVAKRLRPHQLPWSVNSFGLAAGSYILNHTEKAEAYIAATRRYVAAETERFCDRLRSIRGVAVFPGPSGFVLVRLPDAMRSGDVCEAFAADKILIRNCENFRGLSSRFVRFSLKDSAANQQAADKLVGLCDRCDAGGTRHGH